MMGTPDWGLDAKKEQGAMLANCYNVAQQHSGGASREPAAGRGCFRSNRSNMKQPLRPRLKGEKATVFRVTKPSQESWLPVLIQTCSVDPATAGTGAKAERTGTRH